MLRRPLINDFVSLVHKDSKVLGLPKKKWMKREEERGRKRYRETKLEMEKERERNIRMRQN